MIICADDYGDRPDINEAVRKLAELGKLGAISVLSCRTGFDSTAAVQLRPFHDKADIGLHLSLADDTPPGIQAEPVPPGEEFKRFWRLAWSCYTGGTDRSKILAHIRAQYDIFTQKTGFAPDFIDGHMHIHQLPVIRDAVVDFVMSIPPENRPYVRNCYTPPAGIFSVNIDIAKTTAISIPGKKFRRMIEQAGIKTNDGFYGIYAAGPNRDFQAYLERFMKHAGKKSILMVHPGKNEPWRKIEFDTLMTQPGLATQTNRYPK